MRLPQAIVLPITPTTIFDTGIFVGIIMIVELQRYTELSKKI